MRSFPRKAIILLMWWLGIIRLCQFIRRKQIVILMIHGVMDDRDNPIWKPLRPQLARTKLEEYLRVLSRRYRFVSLINAVEMLQGRKPIQPYSLVLTFDDGYRNNLTHALPILRRYSAPATFFVPTGFLDNPRPFWFDRLDYALQQAQVNGREVRIGKLTFCLENSNKKALRESYKRLRHAAKEQQISDLEFLQQMEQLAVQFEEESGRALSDIQENDDWSAILTRDQLGVQSNGYVTFGSHTVDHIRLGLVDSAIARDQLIRSKKDIEHHTSRPCLSLCYPNGSFTDETIAIARKCGYLCGVTTREGTNTAGDDVMRLRRINVPTEGCGSEFIARVCELSQVLSCIKARLLRLKQGRLQTHDKRGGAK